MALQPLEAAEVGPETAWNQPLSHGLASLRGSFGWGRSDGLNVSSVPLLILLALLQMQQATDGSIEATDIIKWQRKTSSHPPHDVK